LWSAEHLTRERVNSARDLKRQDNFHEEAKIPAAGRSLLKDYVRSGYDRGHMAPSGGASNAASQNETFSMANIVPQEPTNNRGVWASIEIGTRNYAKSHGALNVITGPLFIGEKIAFINNRVAVPTHLWKLVYDPGKNAGGVYLVENKDTRDIVWKSIPDFEQFSGYRFNLGSPPLMKMPQPKQRN
jgi:endonuclease G